MDSYVVLKERCPKCEALGKDRNGDNLASFSDGHKYCFSCGYYEGVSGKQKIEAREIPEKAVQEVILPEDSDVHYPQRALDWIAQYELTKVDLLNNNVLWSESKQRLIFPVYGDSALIAYQGRYFGPKVYGEATRSIPKWFGRGDLKNTFHILGKGIKLVLTEDIVSAIKVSKSGFMAMPLFGCVVGRTRFNKLYNLYNDKLAIKVWLDPDKRSEAIGEAKLGRLCGLDSRVVLSSNDPKEHSFLEIQELLREI